MNEKEKEKLEYSAKLIGLNNTLEELSCGISELNPRTKLNCWLSPICGIHEMDADKHEAFANLDTESMTFWNSAYTTI